jgi:hypothetical protein
MADAVTALGVVGRVWLLLFLLRQRPAALVSCAWAMAKSR